jgi:hypothetical protein
LADRRDGDGDGLTVSADCTEDILQTRLPVGVGMWSAVSRAAIAE